MQLYVKNDKEKEQLLYSDQVGYDEIFEDNLSSNTSDFAQIRSYCDEYFRTKREKKKQRKRREKEEVKGKGSGR